MAKERRLGRGLEALLGKIPESGDAGFASGERTSIIAEDNAHRVDLTGGTNPLPKPSESALGGSSLPASLSPVRGGHESRMGHVSQPDPGSAEPRATGLPPSDGANLPNGRVLTGSTPKQGDSPITTEKSPNPDSEASTISGVNDPTSRIIEVEISQIQSNPFQPRGEFSGPEIQSLADSLRAHGLLQPLVVRRQGSKYQLVAGERRLRAAVQAGWKRVPVQVIEADDRQLAELALVENLHRKDLNPLEKAASFQRYLREFGATQEQLASRLKMDRSTVANLLRLLELPAAVQQALREGRITQGHARALLALDDERTQIDFCERIQREGWSVRQTEAMVKKALEESSPEGRGFRVMEAEPPPRAIRSRSQHIEALEREFRLALGTIVEIVSSRQGRGRVIIHFRSHNEFERIRRIVCEASPVPHAKAS